MCQTGWAEVQKQLNRYLIQIHSGRIMLQLKYLCQTNFNDSCCGTSGQK